MKTIITVADPVLDFVVGNLQGYTIQKVSRKEHRLSFEVFVIVKEVSDHVFNFLIPKFLIEN